MYFKGEVYSIQHYVKRFVNDLHLVGCFFGCVALFRQPITPTAHYSDNPLLRQPITPTAHFFLQILTFPIPGRSIIIALNGDVLPRIKAPFPFQNILSRPWSVKIKFEEKVVHIAQRNQKRGVKEKSVNRKKHEKDKMTEDSNMHGSEES
jgi:hypothetical protein